MITYDINSLPHGLDLNTWFAIFKENVAIYDSTLGAAPMYYGDGKMAIIDIHDMTETEIETIAQAAEKIINQREEAGEYVRNVIRENNERFVRYMRLLNDGKDPSSELK
jgi:hypothetical protein